MSNTKHVTDNLSEYLDGVLNVSERARVDAHLAVCSECRAELAELRYVITMTRALPTMRVPRSFTLSAEMAARARPPWRFGWLYASLRGFTAIAAVLLVVVCSADFLAVNRSGGFGAAAPAPAALSVPESSQTTSVTSDQWTNQTKSSATVVVPAAPVVIPAATVVVHAAPAGAAEAVTSAAPLPPGLTSATRQSPQTTLPTFTQTPRAAAPLTGTPLGTARSAAADPSATAVIAPTNTPLPSPSPSLVLTVTVTLYPTLPAPVIPPTPMGFTEILPFRAAEIGLLGALVLCLVATLFVRSARR